MKKLLAKIRKILRDRRTRRFLTRFVSGIAAIVVFVTTYALVLPAITMEKEADCGIEAHQHDDSCYTRELICDIPESDGHQHGESCYSTITSLMCGMDEHEHSLENGCYDDDGNLICEAKEHKHSDGCYEEVRELTCQTPESEGHHHTDACYEKVLTCGKEVHVHSAACYENDPVPDSAVAAGTSSAAAATTSAVSVSSVGMTLSFEGDNTGTGETDEPAAADRPADHGGSADDGGFVDNAGSVERDESGKSDGSEKSDGSGKTDSSVEAASSGEVNADDTVEMTYGSENAGTGSTETANAALTNTDNGPAAADQYVPTLEAVDFNTILNDRTGIYYYHVADGETVEDSSAIPAEDWKRIPNNKERMKNMDEPELGSNDLLRVYLSYTIPAGSLNATNPVARYRLPSNLHLTDSQVKAINENVNGMTGQYVDMSALEITDPARYYAYLGVEAVEGNRRPDEAVEDYLAEQARKTGTDPDEAVEYISAVVRVENVYDADGIYGDKDAYLGQDLIFTFAPYSIEKNQHEYDSKGQPTKAGREIEGWFTLDLNMGQVDLGEAEITTSTVDESEADSDYADGNAEADRAEDGRTEADRAEDGRTEADRAEADRAEGGRTEADRTEDENAADGQTEDEHNANDNNAENSVEDKDDNPAGESEEDTENPQNNTVIIEHAERTAEIVFVEDGRDGKNNKIEKISTRVTVVEKTVIQTQDNDAEENSEESGAGNTEKSAAGSTEESAADNNADRSGKEKTDQTVMPAMSFTDSIRVSTGKPAGIDEDAEGTLGSAVRSLPQEAEVTVRVEADEGTFPAGTTMVLKAVEDLDAVAEAVTETVENSDPSVSADDADHQSEQTKESRNSNTEEKKNLKTYGFQAVDITFLDKNGKDIQPAKPVRVALTSEIAEQVKEEAKTSEVADPLVVHVDDDGNAEQMELLAPEEIKPAQGKTEQELLEEDRTSDSEQEENGTTDAAGETPSVGFTADSFSVYALVYTVDFHYSVNGKMYDFSIPGGGFVSFEHLVEVLGITNNDSQSENEDENNDNIVGLDETKDENGSFSTENEISTNGWNADEEASVFDNAADENTVNDSNLSIVGESYEIIGVVKPSVDENITYREAINLNDAVVSEETKLFTADVVNVEFSSPELVDVSRVETDTTIGEIKEKRGLECEYSADLTEEQIEEINSQAVVAGDWVLISLKPFDTDEILTVTMKNGETFEIRVTDVAYQGTKVTDPNGKTVALLNLSNNNALQSTAHSVSGRLQATEIQVNGNRITSVDPLTTWTFTQVPNSTDRYYIQASNGYLNLSSNGNVTVSSQQQAFTVQQKSDGTIRIKRTDNNYAINNHSNSTANGYGGYDSNWDSNRGEWFTMYEIGDPIIPHVTVHYVLRDGTELTDVEYTGSNPLIVKNADGTFTIPYDWGSGQTSDTTVDFRTQFELDGYTYANTHLAGKDANGAPLTYDGYMIDSVLTRSGSNLEFKSDSGATSPGLWNNPPQGNLYYSELTSFSLSGNVNARPTVDGDRITYATSGNKDIYVILDPVPTGPSGGGAGTVDPGAVEAPSLKKTMEDNEDGTYTLSLKVDAHAVDAEETNKANVLFIVDTSSSMRATTTDNKHNRIMDTHDAVLDLGQRLLAYNDHHPDSVEVSMITFDGGVKEPLDWTTNKTEFQTAVNDRLVYKYLHTGTDWEDSLKAALKKLKEDTDQDPTFVIFFTDGEPSQYTSFHGSNKNSNADPTHTYTGENDPGDGYSDFFSFFLCREASKDEMRAIVDTGAQLYGIYAYNPKPQDQNPPRNPYNSYLGLEGGKELLHNALKYGYNTSESLEGNLFYEVKSTNDLQGAFDRIFNLITEKVGFSNVVVTDGISAGVTSSTVLKGDVSAFTYTVRDKSKAVAYKVTVAPNGAPAGTDEGKPIFWIGGSGTPVVGEIREVSTTKILTDDDGNPILDQNNKIQTQTVDVEVYYYKDADDNEYIMPIAVPAQTVTWDLSPFGILKDGYSYQVDFVVWPNQGAYDLVADLNNGKRLDIEATANWEAQPLKTDSTGRKYRQGGFADYPYISRYEDNGVYSAMSNTEQKVDYYKIDKKIVNGQEVTEINGPIHTSVDPPDPMPLTASQSQIEKQWNVDRNPEVLKELLYGNHDEEDNWIPYSITFGIFQDKSTEEYTSSTLGWQQAWNPETDDYEWLDAPTNPNVFYGGKWHRVGTRWAQDFSIATGLMLSAEEMNALGLNKSKYDHFDYEDVTYYILETGHDYRLEETPKMGFEFDFSAPTYHPMLVDGDLQSVTFSRDEEGHITGITGITSEEGGLSSLKVENTLRGYIYLNKVVVDKNNARIAADDTQFEYKIELQNASEVFDGDHIPWYGVNDLFYHDDTDGDFKYYQAYMGFDDSHNRQLYICTESDGLDHHYPAEVGSIDPETEAFVPGGTFDPNNVTGQVIRFNDESGERIVTIKGNRTSCTDKKYAWAEMKISQNETLSIANVPLGTHYTITETQTSGYNLFSVASNQSENEKAHISIDGYKIKGDIIQNANNEVTYTNKVIDGSLQITKKVTVDNTPAAETGWASWADGEYFFTITGEDGRPALGKVNGVWDEDGRISITITNGIPSTVTITDLRIGEYTITEEKPDNGTTLVAFSVNDGDKQVTNGVVAETDKKIDVVQGGTTAASFTNNIDTTAVHVYKVWADDGQEGVDHSGQVIEYKIYRIPYQMVDDPNNEGQKIRGVSYLVQEVTEELVPTLRTYGFTGTLRYNSANSEKSWKETVSKLPKAGMYTPVGETDAVQVFYEYYVTEETIVSGYKYTISGGEITDEGEDQGEYAYTITNEPLNPTDQETQINVNKEWKNHDGTPDTTLHKDDSIVFEVTQKKYEAKATYTYGGETITSMLYPITIDLVDKGGNNAGGRVHHQTVVYVPEGASFTIEPHYTDDQMNPQVHVVSVAGVDPDSSTYETIVHSGSSGPSNMYYYPGAVFEIENVDSAKEVTFWLYDGNDTWVNLYDGDADPRVNLLDKDNPGIGPARQRWTCEIGSPQGIIWDLNEMLDKVLSGAADTTASEEDRTPPTPVGTFTPRYTMTLTKNSDSGLPTVITRGENAPGYGVGDKDEVWKGSVTNLPLYEYKGTDDKSYIYTYEVTEAAVGSDTVNTVDPPGEAEEWDGQTSSYLVKWDKNTQTGLWTLTNQKKPPIDITIYKVDKDNIATSSSVLKGAKFKLIRYTSLTPLRVKDTAWQPSGSQIPGETPELPEQSDNPGVFSFNNLDAGYYEIVETQYPTGYIQSSENPIFQVRYVNNAVEPQIILVYGSGANAGQPITGNATNMVRVDNKSIVVGNEKGAALPYTGGPGTKLFTIIGSLLIAFAGSLLWRRRRTI